MSGKAAAGKTAAPKAGAKGKAVGAAKEARVGARVHKTRVHTKVHFYRPKTLTLARQPRYATHLPRPVAKKSEFSVIRSPLTSDAAMKKIEDHNTLVFLTDPRANKRQIKAAVKKLYSVTAVKVNTLIRPDGIKKAYVKLGKETDALDVANKLNIV